MSQEWGGGASQQFAQTRRQRGGWRPSGGRSSESRTPHHPMPNRPAGLLPSAFPPFEQRPIPETHILQPLQNFPTNLPAAHRPTMLRKLPADHPLIQEMNVLKQTRKERQFYWAGIIENLGDGFENPAEYDRQMWELEEKAADEKLIELAGQIKLAEMGISLDLPQLSVANDPLQDRSRHARPSDRGDRGGYRGRVKTKGQGSRGYHGDRFLYDMLVHQQDASGAVDIKFQNPNSNVPTTRSMRWSEEKKESAVSRWMEEMGMPMDHSLPILDDELIINRSPAPDDGNVIPSVEAVHPATHVDKDLIDSGQINADTLPIANDPTGHAFRNQENTVPIVIRYEYKLSWSTIDEMDFEEAEIEREIERIFAGQHIISNCQDTRGLEGNGFSSIVPKITDEGQVENRSMTREPLVPVEKRHHSLPKPSLKETIQKSANRAYEDKRPPKPLIEIQPVAQQIVQQPYIFIAKCFIPVEEHLIPHLTRRLEYFGWTAIRDKQWLVFRMGTIKTYSTVMFMQLWKNGNPPLQPADLDSASTVQNQGIMEETKGQRDDTIVMKVNLRQHVEGSDIPLPNTNPSQSGSRVGAIKKLEPVFTARKFPDILSIDDEHSIHRPTPGPSGSKMNIIEVLSKNLEAFQREDPQEASTAIAETMEGTAKSDTITKKPSATITKQPFPWQKYSKKTSKSRTRPMAADFMDIGDKQIEFLDLHGVSDSDDSFEQGLQKSLGQETSHSRIEEAVSTTPQENHSVKEVKSEPEESAMGQISSINTEVNDKAQRLINKKRRHCQINKEKKFRARERKRNAKIKNEFEQLSHDQNDLHLAKDWNETAGSGHASIGAYEPERTENEGKDDTSLIDSDDKGKNLNLTEQQPQHNILATESSWVPRTIHRSEHDHAASNDSLSPRLYAQRPGKTLAEKISEESVPVRLLPLTAPLHARRARMLEIMDLLIENANVQEKLSADHRLKTQASERLFQGQPGAYYRKVLGIDAMFSPQGTLLPPTPGSVAARLRKFRGHFKDYSSKIKKCIEDRRDDGFKLGEEDGPNGVSLWVDASLWKDDWKLRLDGWNEMMGTEGVVRRSYTGI